MAFFKVIYLKFFPKTKILLKKAAIKSSPEDFTKKIFISSVYLSAAILALLFFIFGKKIDSYYWMLIVSPIVFILSFSFLMQYPHATIRKREREINSEVLFAGRYLLVKLESGIPLFNALTDASKSYGVSAKYFKEIVDKISTGTPIEEALENAREYNASPQFKMILGELVTTMKTGVDVSKPLKSILAHITSQQLIQVKEYGKKLNAYMMVYMILAIVVPSLGMTILVVVAAFLSLELSTIFIIIAIGVLIFVQFIFLTLFKSIRPQVNI